MAFLRFKRHLDEFNAAEPIDAVFFEEVRRHVGTIAAHVYGGFLAHLAAWCEHREVPYQSVPVGTIQRHATGKGNADKAAVLAATRTRGFTPADDNEADALAILLWAIATQGGVRQTACASPPAGAPTHHRSNPHACASPSRSPSTPTAPPPRSYPPTPPP